MKCPHCGYDKIQPFFNYCPNCENAINGNSEDFQNPKVKNNEKVSDNLKKCPHCGYDRIQSFFKYCPQCQNALNEISGYSQTTKVENDANNINNTQEKNFLTRMWPGSNWSYEKAIQDPYKYAVWAKDNPNDNRYYLEKWQKEGHDLTKIKDAIAEVNRSIHENPNATPSQIRQNITDTNITQQSNDSFINAVNNTNPTTNAAAIVRNKAIWKLQVGEIARHIAPDEWVYVTDHLGGLVIEEGTSAIIYVDGQEVGQMGSGMYVFDDKKDIATSMVAEDLKTQIKEKEGILSKIFNGLYRIFTGHKRNEGLSERELRERKIQQVIKQLKRDTIIDVYLKSDRVFPAIFGQQHYSETNDGYKPYLIKSRYLDINVGVSMQMQIGDFKKFIANYMPGRKTVNITDIVQSVDSAVRSILRTQLRDIEVSERGLDENTFNTIKNHIKTNLPNLLHGIVIVDILDIATSNEQLDRFRKVEQQLYCSEREYNFLIRTNEFRNRIAAEENDQKIREAHSEQDLRNRLQEINNDNLTHEALNQRDMLYTLGEISNETLINTAHLEQILHFSLDDIDRETTLHDARANQDLSFKLDELAKEKILHDDEMEYFVSLIQKQKVIREAKDEAEIESAIIDITKNRLIKQDELDYLKDDLSNKRFDREQISEQLRAKSLMATVLTKMEIDKIQNIANLRNIQEISAAEFENLKQQKGQEAEGWDLDAMVYGRQYVFERQKMLDAFEMQRLTNEFERGEHRKDIAQEIEDAESKNQLISAEIEGQSKLDQYSDTRKMTDHNINTKIYDDNYIRSTKAKEDEIRLENKKAEDVLRMKEEEIRIQREDEISRLKAKSQTANESMRIMLEAEQNQQKEQHQFELSKEEIELKKNQTEAERDIKKTQLEVNMSAEQIMAGRAEKMAPEAQIKFAESFSNKKEIELNKANTEEQKKLYEQMIEMAKANNVNTQNLQAKNEEQMMTILQGIMNTFSGMQNSSNAEKQNLANLLVGAIQSVSNGRLNDAQTQKEEYRAQMHHEQNRMDETQKQSLNYTTQVKVSENNAQAGVPPINVHVNLRKCSCGFQTTDNDMKCCPICRGDLK